MLCIGLFLCSAPAFGMFSCLDPRYWCGGRGKRKLKIDIEKDAEWSEFVEVIEASDGKSLLDLPEEMIFEIFECFNINELVKNKRVSSNFKELVEKYFKEFHPKNSKRKVLIITNKFYHAVQSKKAANNFIQTLKVLFEKFLPDTQRTYHVTNKLEMFLLREAEEHGVIRELKYKKMSSKEDYAKAYKKISSEFKNDRRKHLYVENKYKKDKICCQQPPIEMGGLQEPHVD